MLSGEMVVEHERGMTIVKGRPGDRRQTGRVGSIQHTERGGVRRDLRARVFDRYRSCQGCLDEATTTRGVVAAAFEPVRSGAA